LRRACLGKPSLNLTAGLYDRRFFLSLEEDGFGMDSDDGGVGNDCAGGSHTTTYVPSAEWLIEVWRKRQFEKEVGHT
jgi:hypothetical protein